MNFVAACAIAAAVPFCCQPTAALAQQTDGGMLSGITTGIADWFRQDWTTGWGEGSTMRLMMSPYTYHFSQDPNHKHVYLIGLERERADGLTVGGTLFSNSFGQPSTYLYVGQRFNRIGGVEPLFAQLTGGLLYGYRAPYEDKVPFNYNGFSPGLVPSIGWQFNRRFSAQINILGNSAVMFQVSADY